MRVLKLTGLREVETHDLSLPVKLLINAVNYKSGEMFTDVPQNSLAGMWLFLLYKASSTTLSCRSSRRRIGWSATTST